jgi:uncharacterized protein YkwD
LPAVRRDPRLDAAAMLHSRDMGIRNFFGHVNPDGLNPGARATAQGYTQGVGENIAYGYANARAVVLGWMASAGHCRNILSGAVDLGVGTVVTGKPYYTQVLGDYFTRPVDEAPRGGCPYSLNLDTIGPAAPALLTEPPAAPPSSTPTPAATATATPTATVTRTTPKPALRALALAPSRFRAGRRGTTISYTLSAPATVTFRIQRARRSGTGRAVRYQTMTKRFTRDGATGANTLRFTVRAARARTLSDHALILGGRAPQAALLATQPTQHRDVRGVLGIVLEVLVRALAGEPDVTALVAVPVVGVRPAGGMAVLGLAHRLEPARAAPWRELRSPLATLKAIVSM